MAVGAIGDDGVLTPTAGTFADPQTAGTTRPAGAPSTCSTGTAAPGRSPTPSWELRPPTAVCTDSRSTSRRVTCSSVSPRSMEPTGRRLSVRPGRRRGSRGARRGPSLIGWTVTTRGRRSTKPPTGHFGQAVDFDPAGLTFVVGASTSRSGYPGSGNGAMHTFSRAGPGPGDIPVFSKRMHGDTLTVSFGGGVAIDGTTIVAGAQATGGEGGNYPGAAFVFEGAGKASTGRRSSPRSAIASTRPSDS